MKHITRMLLHWRRERQRHTEGQMWSCATVFLCVVTFCHSVAVGRGEVPATSGLKKLRLPEGREQNVQNFVFFLFSANRSSFVSAKHPNPSQGRVSLAGNRNHRLYGTVSCYPRVLCDRFKIPAAQLPHWTRTLFLASAVFVRTQVSRGDNVLKTHRASP